MHGIHRLIFVATWWYLWDGTIGMSCLQFLGLTLLRRSSQLWEFYCTSVFIQENNQLSAILWVNGTRLAGR